MGRRSRISILPRKSWPRSRMCTPSKPFTVRKILQLSRPKAGWSRDRCTMYATRSVICALPAPEKIACDAVLLVAARMRAGDLSSDGSGQGRARPCARVSPPGIHRRSSGKLSAHQPYWRGVRDSGKSSSRTSLLGGPESIPASLTRLSTWNNFEKTPVEIRPAPASLCSGGTFSRRTRWQESGTGSALGSPFCSSSSAKNRWLEPKSPCRRPGLLEPLQLDTRLQKDPESPFGRKKIPHGPPLVSFRAEHASAREGRFPS